MDRKTFLNNLLYLPLAGHTMKLGALHKMFGGEKDTERMPVLFAGHGSPMNAIEDNPFSREMKALGGRLPKPKAILMVSAHWETRGAYVTAQERPPTIHDFYGFPEELFRVQYPAPGSGWLAEETKAAVTTTQVGSDTSRGFDHGCWSVARNMFPGADIPIVQLSLDRTKSAAWHYELARGLQSLRRKGVLVIGSGNMVHNLGRVELKGGDFNEPYGFDWALEAGETFRKLILSGDHPSLIRYEALGEPVRLAVPTPEHYLPLLYVLALQEKSGESPSFFNDVPVGGSVTMTSVVIQ